MPAAARSTTSAASPCSTAASVELLSSEVMRILVIGGTRFIGPWVVRRLCDAGHEVLVIHRGQTKAPLPTGTVALHGDRNRLHKLRSDVLRFKPDVAVDMIVYTEAQARDLVSSMQGVTPRLVIVSSADVYRAYGRLHRTEPGPADPVPLGENAPLRERLYPYRVEPPRRKDDADRWRDDYDKILIERLVMNSPEMTGTVVRLPMVYGPGDPQHRFFDPVKRMSDLREYILLEERHARWCCSWGYVENVADAIAIAATNQRAASRIYNVCETSCLSWAELVEAIAEAVGWSGRVLIVR